MRRADVEGVVVELDDFHSLAGGVAPHELEALGFERRHLVAITQLEVNYNTIRGELQHN